MSNYDIFYLVRILLTAANYEKKWQVMRGYKWLISRGIYLIGYGRMYLDLFSKTNCNIYNGEKIRYNSEL